MQPFRRSTPLNHTQLVLKSIQHIIQPRHDIPLEVLEKIRIKRDEMILNLQSVVQAIEPDISIYREISQPPIDALNERTRIFALKMFRVVNEGVNQVSYLSGYLNMTLPWVLNRELITSRMNASPAQAQQIQDEFTGPNNPEKIRFIASQCFAPVINFMNSLDSEVIDNIVGDPLHN